MIQLSPYNYKTHEFIETFYFDSLQHLKCVSCNMFVFKDGSECWVDEDLNCEEYSIKIIIE